MQKIKKFLLGVKQLLKNPKKLFSRQVITVLLVLVAIVVLYLAKSLFVAALVNGKPVFRISVISELEKQGGQNVLDSLVSQSLIMQEAKKRKMEVSDETITSEIEKIEDALKSQGMTLDEALALRGQTRKYLINQIVIQQYVEELLKDKINVTEEEVKDYFDKNKAYFGKETKFESVVEQIREELKSQKLATEYQAWITDIKAKAKVNYFVKY